MSYVCCGWRITNLSKLIEDSDKGSLQLREAVENVLFARAQRGIAAGEQYPRVDAGGSPFTRQRTSESFGIATTDFKRTTNMHDYGLDSTWEIDVFGRIRRSVESADVSLGATVEDYRDTLCPW